MKSVAYISAVVILCSLSAISCGENQGGSANEKDTTHGVVVPPAIDSSGVITTPPVNDSMSINSDSQNISR